MSEPKPCLICNSQMRLTGGWIDTDVLSALADSDGRVNLDSVPPAEMYYCPQCEEIFSPDDLEIIGEIGPDKWLMLQRLIEFEALYGTGEL